MPICGFKFHKLATPPTSADLAATWRPYIETCIAAFGTDRAMFESNFPVDKASCDYPTLWNAFKRIAGLDPDREKLFRNNARAFYRLA
jgi:predicted TIM-barrel fold metal-dependent hydrolase